MSTNHLRIGVVCGEHSGDRLGANLINEIKKNHNVTLYGVGGPEIEKLGLDSDFNFNDLQIMGLIEPIIKYKSLSRKRKSLIRLFKEKKIDIFIGIDSPDFNISIHKELKKIKTCKNIQLVSPSVWAWRQNRIKLIKKYIDLTVCLFKFEHDFYQKEQHKSLHLGHPFNSLEKIPFDEVAQKYELSNSKKYISILPGSRESEIENMLPIFLDFIEKHSKDNEGFVYLIPASDKRLYEKIIRMTPKQDNILIKENSMKEFLSVSDFSIATSGTATLESAVLGCPPIICYKTNPINYFIISRMLKIRNVGLPNILLGSNYFTELIQKDCHEVNILNATTTIQNMMLDNTSISDKLRSVLTGDGFESVANKILEL